MKPTNVPIIIPEIKPEKHKHHFKERLIPMEAWLPFFGYYLSEGNCWESKKNGNCTVTLTTYSRTKEAIQTLRAIGLSPCVKKHHVTATSKQLYKYLKNFN